MAVLFITSISNSNMKPRKPMKTNIQIIMACLITLLAPVIALAAPPIEVVITVDGNEIFGDAPDGKIQVLGFEHEIKVTTDPHTGLSTGSRKHGPVRIVKAIDRASPKILRALTLNEPVTAILRFTHPTDAGAGNYYTITLTGALITAVRQWKPNLRDLSADRAGDLEEVEFTYQTITWEHYTGGGHEDEHHGGPQ